MKNIKTYLKQWLQKKTKTLNKLVIEQLTDRFEYVSRSEYLANCALNSAESGISDEKYCENEVIVSLTTYDRRLHQVYLTIESIMRQTMKPNRIILWLANELENETLPLILQKQQKRGLEIKYYKDIRSYKKLIPALKAFPSAVIITVDDDNIYLSDFIENLVRAHINKPGTIYCTRMHRIKLQSPSALKKYAKWTQKYEHSDVSPLNFPVGCGGILYPPNCFDKEVFNETVFMDICKYADDIWFKSMALLNGVMAQRICTYNNKVLLSNMSVQDHKLSDINQDKSLNDAQIKAVFDKYKLYEHLI